MMYEATSFECSRIAQDLQIRKVQVESVVQLFNEGNSVPFITRYRKERTGGLDEDAIRSIQTRLNFLKQFNERKQTILKTIESHGKLTEELRHEILNAPTVRRLEDLYMPFKPRKKALAHAAREKGLEPLALAIWHSDPAVGNLDELAGSLVNPEKQLNTLEDVKIGVQHLVAEMIHEAAEVRAQVRRVLWKAGVVTSARHEKAHEGQGNEFKPYFQFKEPAQDIRPHRILALNRGEKEGVLKVKLECAADALQQTALAALAEHLLRDAGKPAAAPAQPPQSPKPPQPEPPAPSPTEPPAPEVPPAPPETPPAPPPEAPPSPVEMPPIGAPPSSPPGPHASPLVESLSTEPGPALTGEVLAEGIDFRTPHGLFLKICLDDALHRLLVPNLEREIRGELTDEAELHAVKVFAHNIRSLLMQPPLTGRRVLAIDPGFRTGCKLAALDEAGNLLGHMVFFPHGGGPGGGRRREKKPKEQPASPPATPTPTLTSSASEGIAEAPAPSMEAPVPTPELADTTTATPEMGPISETVTPVADAAPVADAPGSSTPVANAPAAPEPTPVDKRAEAKAKLVEFVQQHQLNLIALGNEEACRDTEEIIADVIASSLPELAYVIVSEAGAGAYSVSPNAKEEFPNLDPAVRSAVSIGRRLQDPLSELVKIDPQSLAAGPYLHDLGRKELKEALESVVESCVNQVGVDVNAASAPMLRYVSGLNQLAAREIVEHRKNRGPFTAREQLIDVTGMGPNKLIQSAGFLKVSGAVNPLDRTWIHPESYPLAERVFAELGCSSSVLDDPAAHAAFRDKLNAVNLEELAQKLEVIVPALDDLFMALARPGRDPRQDVAAPIFKKGVLKLEDLQAGQELKGTVLNVVDFGAFVDVGLKDSGLVHISQIANKYIKSPYDVVSVNDIVKVWVLKIDKDSNHVSLTMIQPGVDRKPPERRPPMPRREGEGEGQDRRGPPRGRSPGGPPREGDREGQRRPPPRGRSGPPRQGGPRREEQREVAPPPPPLPPRKPRREPPKPKLTQAAMEGKAPLRTLSELAAFFAAKEEKANPPAPPVVEEKKEPPPEAPPPEPKPPESPGGEAPPA